MLNRVCVIWCLSDVRPRTSAQRRWEGAQGGLAVPRDSHCQALGEQVPFTPLGMSTSALGLGCLQRRTWWAVSGDSVSWGQQGPALTLAGTSVLHGHSWGPADHVCSLLAHGIPAETGSPRNFPSCYSIDGFHFHSTSGPASADLFLQGSSRMQPRLPVGNGCPLLCSGPYIPTGLVQAPSRLSMAIPISLTGQAFRPLFHVPLSGLGSVRTWCCPRTVKLSGKQSGTHSVEATAGWGLWALCPLAG